VYLVDLVEPGGPVSGEHTRQTWAETSPYGDRHPITSCVSGPAKDGNRLSQTVTYKYGRTPDFNSLHHGFELGAARGGHYYDIGLQGPRKR